MREIFCGVVEYLKVLSVISASKIRHRDGASSHSP